MDISQEEICKLPLVLIHDGSGRSARTVSIQELEDADSYSLSEKEIELKIYRAAIEHYVKRNFGIAEGLLKHLIGTAADPCYEHYERLANVYYVQGKRDEELELLSVAVKRFEEVDAGDYLLQKLVKRVESLS